MKKEYIYIYNNMILLCELARVRERKNFKKGESPFLLTVPQLFILSFYPEKASFLAEKSVAKRHQEREKRGTKKRVEERGAEEARESEVRV